MLPSGPQRSVLRCMMSTEYTHLVPAGMKKGRLPAGAGQITSRVEYRKLKGLQILVNRVAEERREKGLHGGEQSKCFW